MTSDWEKRFDEKFKEGSFVTHAIHTSYGKDREPLDDRRRKEFKQFIHTLLQEKDKEFAKNLKETMVNSYTIKGKRNYEMLYNNIRRMAISLEGGKEDEAKHAKR